MRESLGKPKGKECHKKRRETLVVRSVVHVHAIRTILTFLCKMRYRVTSIFVSVSLLLLVGVSGQQPQCPDFRLIQPCNCQTDNNVVSMVCSNLQSVEQLKRIFEPVYPTNNLWHLTVKNSHLEELETNLFSEKSFGISFIF